VRALHPSKPFTTHESSASHQLVATLRPVPPFRPPMRPPVRARTPTLSHSEALTPAACDMVLSVRSSIGKQHKAVASH